jgi:putative hydrolase of HD superfamily
MDTSDTSKVATIFEKLIELSALSFQYGETFRFTTYPDGKTFESDTDHTFMLGIIACSLRDLCAPNLDRGKVAEYALVHDFVEVYAGDTATLGMLDKSEKQAREHQALLRIKSEYEALFPWIGEAIEKYEAQTEPEARFIKVIDKIMPGLTQIQNGGEIFERLQVPPEKIIEQKKLQLIWLEKQGWPLLTELYTMVSEKTHALPYFNKK